LGSLGGGDKLLGIVHVGDCDFRAHLPEFRGPAVVDPHYGADGPIMTAEFCDECRTGFPRGGGDQYLGFDHNDCSGWLWLKVEADWLIERQEAVCFRVTKEGLANSAISVADPAPRLYDYVDHQTMIMVVI
jgi:hypothetical protein